MPGAPWITLLLTILLSQVYDVDFAGSLTLPGPYESAGADLSLANLTISHMQLPQTMKLVSNGPEFIFDFGSSCAVIKGVADIHAQETVPHTPVDITICGGLQTEPPKTVKASIAPSASGSAPQCNLKAAISALGQNMPMDLCVMFFTFLSSMEGIPMPTPPAPVMPGSSPITASRLLRTVFPLVPGLGRKLPLDLSLEPLSTTTVRLNIATTMNLSLDLSDALGMLFYTINSPENFLHKMFLLLHSSISVANGPILGKVSNLVTIPASTFLRMDLMWTDLTCDDTGYDCSFPALGGMRVANLVLEGSQPLAIPFAKFAPLAESIANTLIVTSVYPTLCHVENGRCHLSIQHAEPTPNAPLWMLIFFPLLFACLIPIPVWFNLRRHHRQPVLDRSGKPISDVRIIVEDVVLATFIGGLCCCFIVGDVTSVASVHIGAEYTTYVFDFSGTVRHLWQAGMIPLSLLMAVFGGAYPFVKMACVVYFCMFRYEPQSRILRAVDVFGKFSLIVTTSMAVCVAGLEIPGLVSVQMLPSFYLFMAATLVLIAVGNYGIHLYRYETSIRVQVEELPSSRTLFTPTEEVVAEGDQVAAPEGIKRLESTSMSEEEPSNVVLRSAKRVWWVVSLPCAIFILAFSIPSFAVTSISYEIGGLAGMVAETPHKMNLYEVASLNSTISLVVILFTVIIAPVLMALFFSESIFLGSWTSADVLLFACIAGLLQLNDYVEATLGSQISAVFTVHPHLHWPLILLLFAAVLTWGLQAVHFFEVREAIARRRIRMQQRSTEPTL